MVIVKIIPIIFSFCMLKLLNMFTVIPQKLKKFYGTRKNIGKPVFSTTHGMSSLTDLYCHKRKGYRKESFYFLQQILFNWLRNIFNYFKHQRPMFHIETSQCFNCNDTPLLSHCLGIVFTLRLWNVYTKIKLKLLYTIYNIKDYTFTCKFLKCVVPPTPPPSLHFLVAATEGSIVLKFLYFALFSP